MYRLTGIIAFLSLSCLLSECRAGGDPFYYATWYAQPSETLAWSSQSVMINHAYSLPYSTLSSTNFGSPRYFHPGFGYIAPRSVYRNGFTNYGTNYTFGMVQPSSNYTGGIGSGIYSGNIWKTQGPASGSQEPGTLHQPWYLPGSPGNSRPFGYAW